MITKSDFRLFLDSPRHLWAEKRNQWQENESEYQQNLRNEGYKVEKLAKKYLQKKAKKEKKLFSYQKQVVEGQFLARADALLYKPQDKSWDLYEVKSSTYDDQKPKLDKSDLYDLTFQSLVMENQIEITKHYLLFLNANYRRQEALNLDELFIPVLVSDEIVKLRDEVLIKREEAEKITQILNYLDLQACYNPKDCGCRHLCHPNLPEHHIYQVFYSSRRLLEKFRYEGINSLFDVSANTAMSDKQAKQMIVYRGKKRLIERDLIKAELAKYQYPLYFLDYETNASAIPEFDGHLPYQNQAVQYSLHVVEKSGKIRHHEYVYQGQNDPMKAVLQQLLEHIGKEGTVLVWNEAFEKSVNEKAALSYPDLVTKLQAINKRIRDLATPFKNQWYLDRRFHGSWSIKNVLPVLCPDLSYQDLEIGKGDVAMIQWRKMNETKTSQGEKERIKKNLLEYCKLDTWAMVRIWQELVKLGGN